MVVFFCVSSSVLPMDSTFAAGDPPGRLFLAVCDFFKQTLLASPALRGPFSSGQRSRLFGRSTRQLENLSPFLPKLSFL